MVDLSLENQSLQYLGLGKSLLSPGGKLLPPALPFLPQSRLGGTRRVEFNSFLINLHFLKGLKAYQYKISAELPLTTRIWLKA
jgi:hypothetical protein